MIEALIGLPEPPVSWRRRAVRLQCDFSRMVQNNMQSHDAWRMRRATLAAAGIFVLVCVVILIATRSAAFAQHRMHSLNEKVDRNHPWMNPKLSPDERAAMVLKEMTLDEKIDLLHGMGMPNWPRD